MTGAPPSRLWYTCTFFMLFQPTGCLIRSGDILVRSFLSVCVLCARVLILAILAFWHPIESGIYIYTNNADSSNPDRLTTFALCNTKPPAAPP